MNSKGCRVISVQRLRLTKLEVHTRQTHLMVNWYYFLNVFAVVQQPSIGCVLSLLQIKKLGVQQNISVSVRIK